MHCRRIKYEEVYLKAYQNGTEARKGIGAYLAFYNQERPHQALGYNLSDPGMEDLLYDVESVRRFVREQEAKGLKLSEPLPDETDAADTLRAVVLQPQ